MQEEMTGWTARPRPVRQTIEGRFVRLEPLDVDRHGRDLYRASNMPDADQKFRWLPEQPPTAESDFLDWVRKAQTSEDPLFSAIIDTETGAAAGRQTLMRIDAANGVIEIGNIYWGPLIARKRGATEALFLAMKHVFDDLGYRRFEWKCNNDNLPSKRAATRFGFTFEGLFRQHMIVKGLNRDTAWFSIIDKEWPALKAGYEGWLSAENFDAAGQQRRKLEEFLR
jgi:RimJ/RimL family protein N-acetyltransferase